MDGNQIFFNGWIPLQHSLVAGAAAYLTMLLMLRATSKRTLSRMTPFDLIIPLTLGPILAATILSPNVSVAQGVLAFGLLLGLHSAMAKLAVRFPRVRSLTKREPRLLLYQGEYLREALRREEVTEEEIQRALREHGFAHGGTAAAVILEADGTFSVIREMEEQLAFSSDGRLQRKQSD